MGLFDIITGFDGGFDQIMKLLDFLTDFEGDFDLKKEKRKYSLSLHPLTYNQNPITQIIRFQFLISLKMPLNNHNDFINLVNALENNHNLKILDISNSTLISYDFWNNNELEQFELIKTAFEKLHRVDCCLDVLNLSNFSHIDRFSKAIVLLITSSRNIKTLNLSNNDLRNVFSNSIEFIFNNDGDYNDQIKTSNIENLIINECGILNADNNLHIFLNNMPKLYSLFLNNNYINNSLPSICNLICNHSSLGTISIIRNQSDFIFGYANYDDDLNQYIRLVQTNPNIINLNFAKTPDDKKTIKIKNKLSIISRSIYNNRLRSVLMLILCGRRLRKINRTFPRISTEVWEQIIMPYLIDNID